MGYSTSHLSDVTLLLPLDIHLIVRRMSINTQLFDKVTFFLFYLNGLSDVTVVIFFSLVKNLLFSEQLVLLL